MPHTIKEALRTAYNQKVTQRDQRRRDRWKLSIRQAFLEQLKRENRESLIEIGAGTGCDSLFFKEASIDVTCLDLSPEMVRMCRDKGLKAHEADICDLTFLSAPFDAAYSMNALLHIPSQKLSLALKNIHSLLKPGGLFFMGVYGGRDWEGIWKDDSYEPKRFFSFHSDDVLKGYLSEHFEWVAFETIDYGSGKSDLYFQSCTVRKKREEKGRG